MGAGGNYVNTAFMYEILKKMKVKLKRKYSMR